MRKRTHGIAARTSSVNQFDESSSRMPRLFLASTLHGLVSARLAIRLRDLGCDVHVWCPADHPATKTRAVSRCYHAPLLGACASLQDAMERASPDFVIPCDDEATRAMHELHAKLCQEDSRPDLRRLIAYSLGEPASCPRIATRAEMMHLAETVGVRVPRTWVVQSPTSIRRWSEEVGFPAVLKMDGSWGGMGVVMVRNIDQARAAYRCAMRPSWRQAIVAQCMQRHSAPLLRLMQGRRPTVTIQKFVPGPVVSHSVACWKGEVLADASTVHLKSEGSTGPATVVRLTDCAEIERATERLVKVLGISGLCGMDFIIEADTGVAHLLEVNPRATPTCHLVFDEGRDLPRALLRRLCDRPLPPAITPPPVATVALFPGEWRRNPRSPYLQEAMHDVPWREVALIRDCMDIPWAKRGAIARAWLWIKEYRRQLGTHTRSLPGALRSAFPMISGLDLPERNSAAPAIPRSVSSV